MVGVANRRSMDLVGPLSCRLVDLHVVRWILSPCLIGTINHDRDSN